MDSAATRCPHCQTRFRVTEAQLKTARGLVRCGACLEVFDATEHWVDTKPQEPPETDSAGAATQLGEPSTNEPPAMAERQEPEIPEQPLPYDRNEIPDDRPTTPDISAPDNATGASYLELADLELAEHDTGDHKTLDHKSFDYEPDAEPAVEETIAADTFDDLVAHKNRSLAISRRQLAWGTLCLLAALLLLAQATYVNFSAIAQSDYRPQLAKTCEVVNFFLGERHCSLPPAQNLARIRSRGLNIFSHPEYADSLMVDALIVNTASFAQPFPVIELQFRDRNGRTVAARRFRPEEYLAGELAGERRMPSRQPVHITIGILDPGASAVNYEMRFYPASTVGKNEPYTG